MNRNSERWGEKVMLHAQTGIWVQSEHIDSSFFNMCVCIYVCVAQSCLTVCDPMDCSPAGSSVHGIFSGKNTGVGCHFLLWGIFLTQGLNPVLLHLLHWQAESLILHRLGSPFFTMLAAISCFHILLALFCTDLKTNQSSVLWFSHVRKTHLRRTASNIWASIFTGHCAMQLHVSSQLHGVYVGGLGKRGKKEVSWIVETKV